MDLALVLAVLRPVPARDQLARRDVGVYPAGEVLYRIERAAGTSAASALGLCTRWTYHWFSNAMRHGIFRDMGFSGLYQTDDIDGPHDSEEVDGSDFPLPFP